MHIISNILIKKHMDAIIPTSEYTLESMFISLKV